MTSSHYPATLDTYLGAKGFCETLDHNAALAEAPLADAPLEDGGLDMGVRSVQPKS